MASDCEVRTLSSIGSEIKSWCKQNKVNQTELAAALDVSTMTVRRVWKGTKELTSVQIAIMLEVMPHVTADFFIPSSSDNVIADFPLFFTVYNKNSSFVLFFLCLFLYNALVCDKL